MDQLVFIKEGKVVTDSLMVAEMFTKDHKNVLRDIEIQIEKLIEADEKEWGVLNFEQTQYQHPQNKQWYPKIDMTEDGFAIIAMGYVTPEAMKMKVRFIKEFKRLRKLLEENPFTGLSQEMKAIFILDKRSQEFDSRIGHLENNMTIDHGQKRSLQKLARTRVLGLLGGKNSSAYKDKSVRGSTFSALWNDYKDYFNIEAYGDTLKVDFERAKQYITRWAPHGKILRDIEEATQQLTFN